MPPGVGYGKGVKKRTARLKAQGMSGKEARQTARKRAASYTQRVGAQRANRRAPAAHTGNAPGRLGFGTNEKIGRGRKGSLKRKLWKAGGTKSELVALRAQTKDTRKRIKKSSQQLANYDIRGTASNMKRSQAYRNAVLDSWRNN